MKPFPNRWLNFEEAYAVGDQLWEFGQVLHDDPRYHKPANWILTFRYAIRAMMARIVTVDRDYRNLNEVGGGLAPDNEMTTQKARNEWNVVWESYAGVLFFAMDSSLECFVHALNALGYLLSPNDFIDITTDKKLKNITPVNLLSPPSKGNESKSAFLSCQKRFPRICGHWSNNLKLVTKIIDYHDATKHRHSAVVGQGFVDGSTGFHHIKSEPKQAMGRMEIDDMTWVDEKQGAVPADQEDTLQSLTAGYRTFMVEWMQIALQDIEAAFNRPLPTRSC